MRYGALRPLSTHPRVPVMYAAVISSLGPGLPCACFSTTTRERGREKGKGENERERESDNGSPCPRKSIRRTSLQHAPPTQLKSARPAVEGNQVNPDTGLGSFFLDLTGLDWGLDLHDFSSCTGRPLGLVVCPHEKWISSCLHDTNSSRLPFPFERKSARVRETR